MKVRATIDFTDLESVTLRRKDDVFEASPKRAAHLMSLGYVENAKTSKPKEEK